jgi:hypothetical protein
MGKGQIISGGDGGLYQVRLNYNRTFAEERLALLDAKIAEQETRIAGLPEGDELDLAKLMFTTLEISKEYYENIPQDPEISAWCADLTEDLTGTVGTIEIGGAFKTGKVLVRPGYEGKAEYQNERDGQLTHTLTMTPAQAFYNAAMFAGWQKWMPTFRIGTITEIDGDTCSLDIEPLTTRHQNIDVTGPPSLAGVEIEYMNCNGAAFEVGDRVIVEYRNRTPIGGGTPVVIGFESEPKPCGIYIRITLNGKTPTKPKTVYLVEETTGKVHTASSHAPTSPPTPFFEYDLCGPFTNVVFPATLYLDKIGGDGKPLFEFWTACEDGAPDHQHFGSSLYPNYGVYGSYLFGGLKGHESLPHTCEATAKEVVKIPYKTTLTKTPALNTVHDFAGLKILMIELYRRRANEGCGELIEVTDKKYYPSVWQGFYPNQGSASYPAYNGCPNWAAWYQCESGYFDEEFGGPIYNDFVAQYNGVELVPVESLAIFTDENGQTPKHTPWEWMIRYYYPYPEPDLVPRYEDGAFWRIMAINTPIDRI